MSTVLEPITKHFTQRKTCRACDGAYLREVANLGEVYPSAFIPPSELQEFRQTEQPCPLVLVLCESCGLVQLQHTVERDFVFRRSWYRSSINAGMRQELSDVATCAIEALGREPERVLDIGCNDGLLLSLYPDSVEKWGCDPGLNLPESSAKVVRDYFRRDLFPKNVRFDIITAISMFYSVEEPMQFLRDAAQLLSDDGVLIVQFNDLHSMIRNHGLDNIVHEHVTYPSAETFSRMANRAGLYVSEMRRRSVNGGSLRFTLRRNVQLHDFAPNVSAILDKVRAFLIEQAKLGQAIYVYGASTRGSTLMQALNLPKGVIRGCAEKNASKVGLFTSGTWLPIVSEEEAKKEADVFLVLPWYFKDEILKREAETIQNDVSFVFPLPIPTKVNRDGERAL